MRTLAALGALALTMHAVVAQENLLPCLTNDPSVLYSVHHGDPAMIQAIAEEDAALEAFTTNYEEGERSTYVIPVVFHIIHNYGAENIGDAQVYDAMRILNEDFNRLNPDWDNVRPAFLPIVANADIEFRLAHKDPNGACTKGITRTVSALTNDGTQTMKNLIQWPRNKYLNVWVAASANGAAGYTLLPAAAAFSAAADGIVIKHDYVGAIGTGTVSRSRALTHEVGHWINLSHTWGGSNTPGDPGNCSGDDNVSDTPNTVGWSTCNLNGASCGSALDNVENFMEYAYCSKMFTLGQKTRMTAAVNSGTAQRNQLTTASNLSATGVSLPAVLCAADFSANTRVVCASGSVTFADESFNAVTSRTWSFAGGSPATSTDEAPSITYNTPGTYAVSLTASDGSSSLTSNQSAYITVLAVPGQAPPVMEGFETTSLGAPDWFVTNINNDNTFGVNSIASYSGTKSVRIVNTAAMDGRKDELISGTFDLSGATQVYMSFRYAYAKRTATSDDALRLYTSNNCGTTWSLRKILRGSTTLTTGGVMTSSFVPSGPSQWGFAEVTNISSTSHVADFRFKFEFESNGGNNLYIDDINILGQPVGVEELRAGAQGLVVLPNPVEDHATLQFALLRAGMTRVDVLDMTGRVVIAVPAMSLAAGAYRIDLPVEDLGSGAYLVRMQQGDLSRVSRFVVK